MSVSPAQLEALWLRLATAGDGQRAYVSLRLEGAGALDVHAALRASDRNPCLLFDLPDPAGVRDLEFEVGGMRCGRVQLESGQGLLLSLEEVARRDLFAKVCLDVIGYASHAATGMAVALVLTRLESWRQFLRSVGAGMQRSELIGIMGELQVLRQLLSEQERAFSTWRAPDDGLHDFENIGHALEVKTTLGPGSRVTISSLDQLNDAGLERLDLVHVRLYESAQGETVDEIVDDIEANLMDNDIRRKLSDALLRRGLDPTERRASDLRASLQHINTFHVTDGFPRILRHDLPAAVSEVSYALDLSVLAPRSERWAEVRALYCRRDG